MNEITCIVCGKTIGGGMYGSGFRAHARACERDHALKNAVAICIESGISNLKPININEIITDILEAMKGTHWADEWNDKVVRREVKRQLKARGLKAEARQ